MWLDFFNNTNCSRMYFVCRLRHLQLVILLHFGVNPGVDIVDSYIGLSVTLPVAFVFLTHLLFTIILNQQSANTAKNFSKDCSDRESNAKVAIFHSSFIAALDVFCILYSKLIRIIIGIVKR